MVFIVENKSRKSIKANRKNNKNKKKKYVVIFSVIIALLLIVSIALGSVLSQMGKIKKSKISQTNEALGIDPSKLTDGQNKDGSVTNDIVNIALFGVDSRTNSDTGNSDSEMILTVDKKHKKLKLSSVMRDSYVNVDGHGMTKINEAYSYGGPQLAIKALNQNFNMDIRDYVTVDFSGMEKIIDALGGITIDIKSYEIQDINECITYAANLEKEKATLVNSSGSQNLNGLQAVAYARIRHAYGSGDFQRTENQRLVLTTMFNKVKDSGALKASSLVTQFLPYIETSLSNADMISLATSVFTSGTTTVDQERFPLDGYCNQLTKDGVWYLWTDIPATTDQMHKYIYDDVKPVPGTPKF